MTEQRRGYAAYMLRLWQVQSEDKATCRAFLESAHTGERVGFASLEELFTFLEKEVCRVTQSQTTPGTGKNSRKVAENAPRPRLSRAESRGLGGAEGEIDHNSRPEACTELGRSDGAPSAFRESSGGKGGDNDA